jgi:hypothetical protein
MAGEMQPTQSFGVPPGKMLSILVLATGLDLISPDSGAAFELPDEAALRVYASNGASLGPLPALFPDGLLATDGFGFGDEASAGFGFGDPATAGLGFGAPATAGFGLGCAFGLPPAGGFEDLSFTTGSGICVMLTSSIKVYGQDIQPRGSWCYGKSVLNDETEKRNIRSIASETISTIWFFCKYPEGFSETGGHVQTFYTESQL